MQTPRCASTCDARDGAELVTPISVSQCSRCRVLASRRLISFLVFISAHILLFRRRVPTLHLRLVLGLNRWLLRVSAYAAVMTREYPPFRARRGRSESPRAH